MLIQQCNVLTFCPNPHRGRGTPRCTRGCSTDIDSIDTESVVRVECRQSNSGSGHGVVKVHNEVTTIGHCVCDTVTTKVYSYWLPVDDSGPVHRVLTVILTHSIRQVRSSYGLKEDNPQINSCIRMYVGSIRVHNS